MKHQNKNRKNSSVTKTVNIALQGGGAHGAFAWGVLDKLLEDGRIAFDGICSCSAGTMNACAMAYGMHLGGPEKARECLHDFWHNVHKANHPIPRMPWETRASTRMTNSLVHFMFDTVTRLFSPYQFNPFDINPLRDVLAKSVDFEALRQCECLKLFVSATNVRTGKVHVFEAHELTLDVAMASACLPLVFRAVEIDGENYWDGGYMGNPSLFPLFYKTGCRDIVIIHINPIERNDLPTSATGILNRINEISFNSSLLKDMRAIAFVKKLIEHDMIKEEHKNDFKDILLHSIRADKATCELNVASKSDTDWEFLTGLRDQGREMAEQWLQENFTKLGVEDSVDLHNEFVGSVTDMFNMQEAKH